MCLQKNSTEKQTWKSPKWHPKQQQTALSTYVSAIFSPRKRATKTLHSVGKLNAFLQQARCGQKKSLCVRLIISTYHWFYRNIWSQIWSHRVEGPGTSLQNLKRSLSEAWLASPVPEIGWSCTERSHRSHSYIVTFFFRWYSWAIHRFTTVVWIRRIPTRGKLPISRRLRWQRETVFGNHLLVVSVQNQISRKLLPVERESWVCQHKSHLWVLRWM